MKKQSRVSDSADGASESASKKSVKFAVTEIPKVVSDESEKQRKQDEKKAIKAKRDAERDAEKAKKEAEKARKEAERKAEKAKKEELARQRQGVYEDGKLLKQKIVEKREAKLETSNKRKASSSAAARTKLLWPLYHHLAENSLKRWWRTKLKLGWNDQGW